MSSNAKNHQQAADDRTIFGFWIYLMTDCVLFASRANSFGGPDSTELFHMPYVLAETLILLTSSFTCGLAILAAQRKQKGMVLRWLAITAVLGLAFLGLEINEFRNLAEEGNSWTRSGFLSAFFTLVGTHGLHISAGLLWMGVMMRQVYRRGLTRHVTRRLVMLSLFWHFLDLVWIFIFTIVYMYGAAGI